MWRSLWWLAERASSTRRSSACSTIAKPAVKKLKLDVATELISSIPLPLDYDLLPYRDLQRAGTPNLPASLPSKSYRDLYSLFTLFLTKKYFETIIRNINYYTKA